MSLTRINNNISALTATRNLNSTGTELAKSLERLSSGLRINRAADDAAGLSISEIQRTQIRGLNRALQNGMDAISLVNTAEGALIETTNRLQRMRELTVQAANSGGNDPGALQALQDEIEESIEEINRIGEVTQFSTRRLLNGDHANSASVAAGTRSRGVSVADTTVASTLSTGLHFLTIERVVAGTEFLDTSIDPDFVNNSGIAGPSAIAGSTFETGLYELHVSNFQPESARMLETTSFLLAAGTGVLSGGSLLVDLVFAGRQFVSGDTIAISGVDENGTSVAAGIAVDATTTLAGLISGINGLYDDGALDATAALAGTGLPGQPATIRMTNQQVGISNTSLALSVTPAAGSPVYQSTAQVVNTGNYNTAVVALAGGPAVQVVSGDTVTLFGRDPVGELGDQHPPQITISFGSLSNGVDILNIAAQEYEGSLDGGGAVRFRNGQREVRFRTGNLSGFESGEAVLLNFGSTLDMPAGTGVSTQATVVLSATNNGLNFQIGANEGQSVRVDLGDIRASSLGYVDGIFDSRTNSTIEGTLDTLDVRTVEGAERALQILDRAISQVTRQRSFLGAITNRMEGTIDNLGIAVENLTAAESRIRDADIAFETTIFTRNQILVQAGTAILAQANAAPQAVLQLLA